MSYVLERIEITEAIKEAAEKPRNVSETSCVEERGVRRRR